MGPGLGVPQGDHSKGTDGPHPRHHSTAGEEGGERREGGREGGRKGGRGKGKMEVFCVIFLKPPSLVCTVAFPSINLSEHQILTVHTYLYMSRTCSSWS